MPGGRGQITGAEGNTFSAENQPNRYRQGTKWLTDGLISMLEKDKEIILEGVDVKTGMQSKFRVKVPNMEVMILALLKAGAKGNVLALSQIWDRVEGKVSQPIEMEIPRKKVKVLRPKQIENDGDTNNEAV